MTKKIIQLASVLLSVIIILSSCSLAESKKKNNNEEGEADVPIVGEWVLDDEFSSQGYRFPSEIKFNSDGSVFSNMTGGKYTIEDDTLNIFYSAMDSYSYTFKLKGNSLTLKDTLLEDEPQCTYSRKDENNSSSDTDNETLENQTRLSDQYYLLADGANQNGDIYELVASEENTATSVTVKIGVIKNNSWLLPLTQNHPFIDQKTGMIKFAGYRRVESQRYPNEINRPNIFFEFIGNSCFSNYNRYYTVTGAGTIYNAENGKSLQIPEPFMLIPDVIESKKINGDSIDVFSDTNIFLLFDEEDNVAKLNTTTMTKDNIGKLEESFYVSCLSEGLFFAKSKSDYTDSKKGFFSADTLEMVIDLSNYHSIYDVNGFIDGKTTFIATNESGSSFEVTIDKTGKVLSEKPYEKENNN